MVREKKTTVLRRLLGEGRTLVKPSAFNALSAIVIEQAGFKCCGVSGYGVSATLLGKPDVGLVTLDEMVMVSRYIAAAVSIPVIADADTGYGNAINVMRTVESFIGAGVAAIQIEDQVAPKRCGYLAGFEVVSAEEMAGKVRMADRIRRELDPDFVIIARCDARGAPGGSLEEVIRRCNLYLEAGADMVYPVCRFTEEELEYCLRQIRGPLQFLRTYGATPMLSLERMNELGIAMVGNFDGALESSTRAMWDYMRAFASEDGQFLRRFGEGQQAHPMGAMNDLLGFPHFQRLEKEFLPRDEVEARYRGALDTH